MKKRRLSRVLKKKEDSNNINENIMKVKGEEKQYKGIISSNGNLKKISSTQKGQQIIFDESLRILPLVKNWIDNESSRTYRGALKEYFKDDDIILQKITECFLYISGTINLNTGDKKDSSKNKKSSTRYKFVNSIQEKLMPELDFNNVWRFIEVCISFSQYFESKKVEQVDGNGVKRRVNYTCSLSDVILEELNKLAIESFYPLPMRKVPVEWSFTDGVLKGGYETYQYDMVRQPQNEVDYSKFSQNIYDSVNYIQSIPWKVNVEVLTQLKKDLKAPLKKDFIKTDYPNPDSSRWDIDLKEKNDLTKEEVKNIEGHRKLYREKSSLYNAEVSDYESAVGKFRYAKLAIQIAEKYVGSTIYFPHSFDFRGRIYPLPIGLSPQGSDSIKALLLYANEERMTKMGLQWCWAYLASLYGDDKLPFKQRIKRGKELIDADYKEADEPYQFLSHQLELKKFLADPTYKPSVRIHLDACNSGSQFTSAITGDLAGCKATNVIPTLNEDDSQKREDAYILVSDKSISLCNEMIKETKDLEKISKIKFFKNLLLERGRKICKVPVMVSNYGGTAGGRAEIVWNMLRELKVEVKWITKSNASLFGKIIGESIFGVLNGGKAFETYIQKLNNIISKDNKPIVWTTSDGFYVVHSKNKELKPKRVKCIIPGARNVVSIQKKQYSKDLSPSKMKSAISPNYIHSLDAELLRRVALRMKQLGVMDTDWIHDSFGCHPNYIDKLLEVTKEEFLNLMESNPLKLLDTQLREQIPMDNKSQKESDSIRMPDLGGFNEENNLKKVLISNWFFS